MCRKSIYLVSFVFVLGVILTSTAIAADPSLVGWWKFEEASGTLFDQSDNHNDGTAFNGVLYQQAGQIGYALGFDGTDDYVTIGTTGRPADTFSFGGWFKTSVTHEIDAQTDSGVGGVYNQRYVFEPRHGGDLNAGAGLSIGTNGISVYEHGSNYMPATAVYATNLGEDWNHIMIVYNNKQPTIYLNGRAVCTGLSSPRAIVYAPVQLGGMAYGYFEGLMDEVRIYNRVLSAAEIKKLAACRKAWNPNPLSGVIYKDIWVTLSWSPGDFAVSHDVYFGENFEDVDAGIGGTYRGNQSLMYYMAGLNENAYPDGLVPGTTYYWRIDEVNEADPNSPWKGDIWSFTIPPKTAYNPDPADDAEFVDLNTKLKWTAGFGAKLHYIVLGEDFDEVSNAAMGIPTGTTTYNPGQLKLAGTYYWRVDEFDGTQTNKGEIWSFSTVGAVGSPNPPDGAVDVKPTVILCWDAGAVAASHEVYFGTDAGAVRNATTAWPEYKGPKSLGDETYYPGQLKLNTTYYWRIDEVNSVNPESPWAGKVWNFTTGDFLSIDDFEDYDAGENQIWYAWHDGLGYGTPGTAGYYAGNGTGAAVGDETAASYTEETIVHSGNHSMPVAYDNNKQGFSKYSEVELTLSAVRDWTAEGVEELSLWFYGGSTNDSELMYVAVSNSTGTPAIVVHNDPAAATIGTWTEWVIPLQTFADQGINLTNVDRIAIGLGTKGNMTIPGGSGKMYFDDIRLNRPQEAAME
jgi:hypothetical protein